jgi:hypothetical protein
MKYRATVAAWLSSFFEKPFVGRVNRRMDIRIKGSDALRRTSNGDDHPDDRLSPDRPHAYSHTR